MNQTCAVPPHQRLESRRVAALEIGAQARVVAGRGHGGARPRVRTQDSTHESRAADRRHARVGERRDRLDALGVDEADAGEIEQHGCTLRGGGVAGAGELGDRALHEATFDA